MEKDRRNTTVAERQRKELVTLGGLARTEDGKLSKSNYFAFLSLDMDDQPDWGTALTPEEARKIATHMQKLTTGVTATVPLICAGELCPFKDHCSLYEIGKHPIAKRCPIEKELINHVMMTLIEEYDVDPENFTELSILNELTEIHILEMRINMNLSKAENAALLIDQTVGVDRDGDPVVQKQLSPLLDLKEKLSNRRAKLIKLMVGDRQEKYKRESALKMRDIDDPSKDQAKTRAKLEALQKRLDTMEAGDKMSPEAFMNADE